MRNQDWIRGKIEYGAAETTIGLPEMVVLFHALAGLCVGWKWGMPQGIPVGVASLLGGGIAGLSAGFLMTRLSQSVNLAWARSSRRHRLLSALIAACGHSVWLGVDVAFWCLWLSILRR